jgi:hypothetical protein
MNTMILAISKIQGDYISKIVLKMRVQFHWMYHKLPIKQVGNIYLEIANVKSVLSWVCIFLCMNDVPLKHLWNKYKGDEFSWQQYIDNETMVPKLHWHTKDYIY